MKKCIFFLIMIILINAFLASSALASGAPQTVLEASASVVYIEVESTTDIFSGSGFIVKNDINGTYIATNNHVIEDNPSGVSVWTGENEKRSATVVANSEEYDLAIIKLSEPLEKKELKLSTIANQGDEVFAVGYPSAANALSQNDAHLSDEATITNGIISSIKSMKNVDYGPNVKMLQINAEINLGNSGGPLLNDKGEVIGINTYGVLNSQGIFGAISVSELIKFIETNQLFQISTTGENVANWIFIVAPAFVLVALIICGIIFIPRTKSKTKNKVKKELLLNDYLSSLENNIDAYTAVSLTMPILLYLRNKHNEGSVFLKLSPSRLTVTMDGCNLRDSEDIPTDEFISPEQSKGAFAGIRADVYGVCAILRHMLTYRNKDKSDEFIADPTTEGLIKIVSKGLLENPEDRFASMQELIFELSPFNTGINEKALDPFKMVSNKVNIQESPQDKTSIKIKKPRTIRKKLIIILTAFGTGLIVLAFVGYSAISYVSAMNNARSYNFREASIGIYNTPFSQALFPQDYTYIGAGVDMLNRNYDDAIIKLETLGDYNGAAELINEAKYRKAAMLADESSYDEAVQIYTDLNGYMDSANLINDTLFRKASYCISTGKYEDALGVLQGLSQNGYAKADSKIQELYYTWGCDLINNENYIEADKKLQSAGNYENTLQVLSDLKDTIYYSAVDAYLSAKYNDARKEFNYLGDYLDAKDYLVLLNAHVANEILMDFTKHNRTSDMTEEEQILFFAWFSEDMNTYEKLGPLIGFQDTAELIMSNQKFAQDFLVGNWRGDSRYFIMDINGNTSYDIPWFTYGDYYTIENGEYLLYKEKTPDITKAMYKITIINDDCIQILSYKNYKSYTLFRQ